MKLLAVTGLNFNCNGKSQKSNLIQFWRRELNADRHESSIDNCFKEISVYFWKQLAFDGSFSDFINVPFTVYFSLIGCGFFLVSWGYLTITKQNCLFLHCFSRSNEKGSFGFELNFFLFFYPLLACNPFQL